MSLIYSYRAALGDFDTDDYNTLGENSWIIWMIFLGSTMVLSIVMLNLLIAIMGDTYD